MKAERSGSYGHVLKYTGVFGGVQGLNILVGLVRNKFVALLLGPGGMGLASLFNTTVQFLSQATNLGISLSAVRHVSELFDAGDEARISHFIKVVRVWSLLTALLGMLVCVVIGPLLSDYTFSWGNHTLHFILLAPAVGMLAITGGETAILKGTRRLRSLAVIQVFAVLVSLVLSVPAYYVFGEAGIVPVIVLMALATMLLTLRQSLHYYPLRLKGTYGLLGEGMEMVRLGVAFVMAGIMGSGAEVLIRSFLNVSGNLDVVGLYNAGFMLTITYGGMVFSAMETDYFPRLSGIAHDNRQLKLTVNRQIEVSLLIVSPMLAVLIIGLPLLMPLLFSSKFLLVVAMAQVAVFSMYAKAISLPIAYITLARGHSLAYLLLEASVSILQVVLIVVGFRRYGLFGTGVALSATYVGELLLVYAYAHLRYGYRLSRRVASYAAVQLLLGVATYVVTLFLSGVAYWLAGGLFCLASLLFSLIVLRRNLVHSS